MKILKPILSLYFLAFAVLFNSCAEKIQPEAYLFAYFIGNGPGQEAVHYAISDDGFTYRALNNYLPVIDNDVISKQGGVRDPHILRSDDGKSFYMVLTDLYVPNDGWTNESMILLKSDDLVNWTHSNIHIPTVFPENFKDVRRVWAPQTIYDAKAGKYMVYWSMQFDGEADIIYYAYANKDFTALESEPKQLFYHPEGKSCIDGDIIFHEGKYHLFFKTEGHGNGLKKAVSDKLTEGYEMKDEYLQQTKEAVEGSGIFKLNDSEKYILMYDVYMKGSYQFTESTDLESFTVIDEQISMDFHPRHGSVLPITLEEKERLLAKYGYADEAANGNPVLKGYYADPEIIYSEKEQKYFLYPTSDGYDGWSGTYFKTFSSENLRDWKEEAVILDLKKDVSWSDMHAWAPTMLEVKRGDDYEYFYYFTASQKIGVATSNSPSGPFLDMGKPLVDSKPEGVRGGQEIDPDIFEDPQSGKTFLYWGNGYLAAVPLNDDLMSYDKKQVKVMTPDESFREGVEVFFRKGKYYFLWSEDDTRSENYRVRYAISDSPLGPLEIPENNLILKKNPKLGIYGTGHNSVINVHGTDDWMIVYHRFNRPKGINMGGAAGFHREVCIDKMEFDEAGYIKVIEPTLEGVVLE
ncbi:family 43 glycosylhydrolase [Belliella kenyensis]|uniref:Family 43 glycosylhydrolase n=1 Tax=Belliella kenyensis TaxID=1472724 RepID=A0ABV8EG09_9BACT|nr:family 43 glycosylhydrolase [Belliella kenyensis]MCH7400992.1 family 43 glycosylhydrolase [Belliella kenyensis]MDN3603990.1 family 43 glycosylhydrolase [Belliella kenyensis]